MIYYDVLIVGAGQAAIPLAWELAKNSRKVAIAERKHLGGSCVNFGCTPTKAAIACAKLAHEAGRAAGFGLKIPTVTVDFGGVLAYARSIAEESRLGLEEDFAGVNNPSILRGHARLTGRSSKGYALIVGDTEVSAGIVVLDTGTRSVIPPIPGLDKVGCIHAGNWLDHKELPKRLVVIGGGTISLEMAQFYARLGSKVTVLESSPQILSREDADVAKAIQWYLEEEGVCFRLGAKIASVAKHGKGVRVELGKETIDADAIFVATGRKPNTDDLGLEAVGVLPDEHGLIPVDKHLKVRKNLFAVGDIRPGPQFTHTSWDDYRILKSQLLGNGSRTTKRIVPYATFTDPELGRVGLSEKEAREKGLSFRVGRFDMCHNGLARERNERRGFIKVLVENGTDKLIGAAVLGTQGGELVQAYANLMVTGGDWKKVRDCVVSHPTLMEAMQSALEAVPEK